ncbi:hypothetical protein IWQ62_001467 [Dispira parvispora]|uniref:Alanine--tRNA ligase n=1 Tax=Dispira parvispora TaxID=1520584 RepID=A0A9W8AXX0_9FUNG|nr:hypothetical protein IWQ62_001467 [Dispira parvispora]
MSLSLLLPRRANPRITTFFVRATVRQSRANVWTSAAIRKRFLDYFASKDHRVLPSASLIPEESDQSLLFTNAGMVPFKKYFQRPDTAPHPQVATIQKCLRAGGKHNDLDNVGYTPRHHTFFEMMGNFSFGGYDKRQAIIYAWEFLTQHLQLPVDRLRVSVLASDTESQAIWKNIVGLSADHIDVLGSQDNFWSMGDGEGPCGPCTEIFWDTRQLDRSTEDRWLEIWNIVFMEFYRDSHGKLDKLPTLCIDTGMGLERMASVLQNRSNNFDTDALYPLVSAVGTLVGGGHSSLDQVIPGKAEMLAGQRIIADHLRSSSFLIADGVVPSNVGRGYILRRIIRRAVRAGRQLGLVDPFLRSLYPTVTQLLGNAYPELTEKGTLIADQLHQEESIFYKTLDKGLLLLEQAFSRPEFAQKKLIDSHTAFTLYDTHGFPVDLTCAIAKERGWQVDTKGFAKLQQKQRERSQHTWKTTGPTSTAADLSSAWADSMIRSGKANGSTFVGYDPTQLTTHSKVLAIQPLGKNQWSILLDRCPFYGLGGGQVPDRGTLRTNQGVVARVTNIQPLDDYGPVLTVHLGEHVNVTDPSQGSTSNPWLRTGDTVTCQVDLEYRRDLTVHHSATHVLNSALRQVLGREILQAGSLVEHDRLRFDFTSDPLTAEQLAQVEAAVNDVARNSLQVTTRCSTLQEAKAQGALASFTEKYADTVRVVEELCCGTHVANTASLYPFKILNERSVAAGTRRIEAKAGWACIAYLQQQQQRLDHLAENLRTTPDKLEQTVAGLQQEHSETVQALNRWINKLVRSSAPPQRIETTSAGTKVYFHEVDTDFDIGFLRRRAAFLREDSPPDVIHVLTNGSHVLVTLGATQSTSPTAAVAHHSGKIVQAILKDLGGKGGGQAHMAQGKIASNTPTTINQKFVRICLAHIQ